MLGHPVSRPWFCATFIHIDDAARATVLAVAGPPGTYNMVDDISVKFSEWLPVFVDAVGARPSMRVPVWLARIAASGALVAWMRTLKGASNARAKSALGWTPVHPCY